MPQAQNQAIMDPEFEKALKSLSEADKNRLVCCYLNSPQQSVDWQKATTDFGSASVESMKVMTRYAIKKMEKATGKEGEEPKAARGGASKRKGKGDGNDAEPKPKKSRGKKAKGEIPKAEDGVAADGEALIKDEGGELD